MVPEHPRSEIDGVVARRPFYLSGFRRVTGSLRRLTEVAGDDIAVALPRLEAEGCDKVFVTDNHSINLAAAVLQQEPALRSAAGIVYATEDTLQRSPAELVPELLKLIGAQNTPAFVISGNNCGNLGGALMAAGGFLEPPGRIALLVTADRGMTGTRVLQESMSVLGDAAACCVISPKRPERGYRLAALSISMRADAGLPEARGKNLRATLDGVSEAVSEALSAAGWERDGLQGMVVGNYGQTARRLLGMAAGSLPLLEPSETVGGHCFSSDLLHALGSFAAEDRLAHGDRLVALASGPSTWSALALEHVSVDGNAEAR